VMLSWQTNIPATSRVVYGSESRAVIGAAPNYGYEAQTAETVQISGTHSVTVTGLNESQKYFFRPVAKAPNVAEGIGNEFSWNVPAMIGGSVGLTQEEQAAPVAASSASISFSRPLSRGAIGNDVRLLQQLFNAHGIVVAVSGVGSPGRETVYFGLLTERAVQKFQAQYGIVSSGAPETTGYGRVGPKTLAKLQEVFGDAEATPAAATAPAETPLLETATIDGFAKALWRGVRHADVKKLQQFLNLDSDTKIAVTGVGSPGNETDYFGAMTENAVQRFQVKYGIVSSGAPQTTGYGVVGPKTMAKLNALLNR